MEKVPFFSDIDYNTFENNICLTKMTEIKTHRRFILRQELLKSFSIFNRIDDGTYQNIYKLLVSGSSIDDLVSSPDSFNEINKDIVIAFLEYEQQIYNQYATPENIIQVLYKKLIALNEEYPKYLTSMLKHAGATYSYQSWSENIDRMLSFISTNEFNTFKIIAGNSIIFHLLNIDCKAKTVKVIYIPPIISTSVTYSPQELLTDMILYTVKGIELPVLTFKQSYNLIHGIASMYW